MKIGFVIFPHVTALDFTGPAQVFSQLPHCEIFLIAKNHEPVATDAGFSVNPTVSIQHAPQMDVLCIPGGLGQKVVSDDSAFMQFIQQQGEKAKFVTSVCSGSLILAKAGLLDGYQATSHWAVREQLARFDVEVTKQRVVIDRNRVTGGGVTAGIDFALRLIATCYGDETAKLIQLGIEYDPAPPFDCGTPEKAGSELAKRIMSAFSRVAII